MKYLIGWAAFAAIAAVAAFGIQHAAVIAQAAHDSGLLPMALAGVKLAAVAVTSYPSGIDKAVAGMIADMNDYKSDSRTVEDDDGIGFGLAVSQGTGDRGCTIGGSAFIGVTIKDSTQLASSAANVDTFETGKDAPVMTEGKIWVKADGAVTPGDNVTYNTTTGRLGSIGTDGTHLLVTGARWDTTAAGDGLAILRLTGALQAA